MNNLYTLLLATWMLLLSVVNSGAQTSQQSNLFHVNETVPDFALDTILNYTASNSSLAKFRGKYLLLDFWGTFCVPCIAAIPKMEKLQEQFRDKLTILMVGTDGYDRITNFYAGRKKDKRDMKLPTAINRNMTRYFNVREVPHYVWIDTKGVIKAVTSSDHYINEENITNFINGKDLSIPLKQRTANPPLWKPLDVVAMEIDSTTLTYRSSFTKHLQGLTSSTLNHHKTYPPRVRLTNMAIPNFYRIAYARPEDDHSVMFARTIVETKYPERYSAKGFDFDEWRLNNTFCYELRVPEEKRGEILKMMQDDLKNIFGLKAYWEDRVMKCIVLTADKNNTSWRAKDTTTKTAISGGGLTLKNQPFSKLFGYIQHYRQGVILVDDTGIDPEDKVDVDLQAEMINVEALNKALKKYGFQLKHEDRKVPVLVISDGTL